jgi:very-short-patch-repair endonuclease
MFETPKADALRRREHKRSFAKAMRAVPTDAERKLWSLLRNKQMLSLRFRRQQPIGPYIADFFCATAKLIVELDGGQHGLDANIAYDKERTCFLNERGYRVLRFANMDVLRNPESVCEGIRIAVLEGNRPLPEPPGGGSTLPQGEG